MVKLQTYAAFSFLAAIGAIYHAFSSREQFYPATVYLSTSKICYVLLLNMVFVMMCVVWQSVKCLFLGSLREAEVDRLNEQAWREVMELLFAITIFRQDFSVTFLAMVTALLLIKAWHWLAQKRVEYIETTPSTSMASHIRIVSFMGFLLLVDCLCMYSSLKLFAQSWKASVLFSFEYTILATTALSTFVKYIFYVRDVLMEGQWEKKAVYTFYLELICDLVHLSLYMLFFLVIFVNYGVPLHLIRELYEKFRNFRIRVSDYIRYHKLTSNMNERFPDATSEELSESDATCIVCREEMVTAKKLVCGHLFHVHCLRSWLERHHTCPTCRALVVPPENGSVSSRPLHFEPQPGPAVAEGSIQASEGGPSNHCQMRLQAASLAASMYEKSFVHLPNSYKWPPGFVFLSNPQTEEFSWVINAPNGTVASGTLHQNHSMPPEQNPMLTHFLGSSTTFIKPAPGKTSFQGSEAKILGNLGKTILQGPLKIDESFEQSQIEFLQARLKHIQTQLQDLQHLNVNLANVEAAPTSSTSAAVPDCGSRCNPEDSHTD